MRLGCQPLTATLLDVVDIEIVGRAAIEAHLDGLAEGIHLGGAELFAFLPQAQAIPHSGHAQSGLPRSSSALQRIRARAAMISPRERAAVGVRSVMAGLGRAPSSENWFVRLVAGTFRPQALRCEWGWWIRGNSRYR